MLQGIRSDGSEITPYYKPYTRQKKIEKGRDPDIVTLYDTGEFYRAMYVDVGSDIIEIDSTDWKSGELKKKYGENIFGLTDEGEDKYISQSFEVFRKKIEELLNLKFS